MELKVNTLRKILNQLKREDHVLKIEHTGFFPEHQVNSGRNQVSTLLELKTRIIEAQDVYIERGFRNSNNLTLYINSRVKTEHRFGRQQGILVKFRLFHGMKTVDARFDLDGFRDDGEDRNVQMLRRLFGYELTELGLNREETDKKYASVSRYDLERLQYGLAEGTLKQILDSKHGTLSFAFVYTDTFNFRPEYFRHNARSVEFGYKEVGTYNSLPSRIRITRTAQIKTVGLYDLGIEGPGYYSHHDRMQIRPEQVSAARQFKRDFASKLDQRGAQ